MAFPEAIWLCVFKWNDGTSDDEHVLRAIGVPNRKKVTTDMERVIAHYTKQTKESAAWKITRLDPFFDFQKFEAEQKKEIDRIESQYAEHSSLGLRVQMAAAQAQMAGDEEMPAPSPSDRALAVAKVATFATPAPANPAAQ